MAKVVFVLGAGFNCSVLDPRYGVRAPLARNFFEVYFAQRPPDYVAGIRAHGNFAVLLDEIKRFWHLDVDELRSIPFDMEEC